MLKRRALVLAAASAATATAPPWVRAQAVAGAELDKYAQVIRQAGIRAVA